MSQRHSSLSFEPIADRYDATRGGEQRGQRTAANLAPLLDPAAPVLEVGIGTGIVALALRQLGFTVVGVDLSPAMAQRARRRLGPVVAVADAAQLPSPMPHSSRPCRSGCCTWWRIGRWSLPRWPAPCGPVAGIW